MSEAADEAADPARVDQVASAIIDDLMGPGMWAAMPEDLREMPRKWARAAIRAMGHSGEGQA